MRQLKSTRALCTIVTGDWVPRGLALYDSLRARGPKTSFIMLIAEDHYDATRITRRFPDIEVLLPRDLCREGAGKRIYQRYFHLQRDNFRWSMKPVLIDFLLTQRGYGRTIYLDPDMYCCNDFDFLFEKLSERAKQMIGYQCSDLLGWVKGRSKKNLLQEGKSGSL